MGKEQINIVLRACYVCKFSILDVKTLPLSITWNPVCLHENFQLICYVWEIFIDIDVDRGYVSLASPWRVRF